MDWETIEDGSLTSVPGISAGAVKCGLKETGNLDLALALWDPPANMAGMFTSNRVKAAPVLLCRERLSARQQGYRAVVINAGIANACNGPQGLEDAREMAHLVAQAAGVEEGAVLVMSTGVIGRRLPMERLRAGILKVGEAVSPYGGHDFVRAIMTTDTVPKEMTLKVSVEGGEVTLAGVAKGAGMMHPNLATMLVIMATDAGIEPALLDQSLRRAVECSFHCITVDGDTSTNDTVLLAASGASGVILQEGSPAFSVFQAALEHLAVKLAQMLVRDAEGASKFVEVSVRGAGTRAEARKAAFAIANSSLVKTALYGEDPNWGRIMCALGYSGVEIEPERIGIDLGEVPVVRGGQGVGTSEEEAASSLRGREIRIGVDLGLGEAEATIWTSDLSREYVTINADYTT